MKTYITILISLVGIDIIWIGVVAKNFYQKHIGFIMADKFTITPAIIFYALYAFGIMYFVVSPALAAKSLSSAVFRGALLGLLAYGAYDLTNQATLANWPLKVTIVDMLWGMVVTALVSTIAYLVISKI
jgi:uncharacterized membrane protein